MQVELIEKFMLIHRIAGRLGKIVVESPAVFQHQDGSRGDALFQFFAVADQIPGGGVETEFRSVQGLQFGDRFTGQAVNFQRPDQLAAVLLPAATSSSRPRILPRTVLWCRLKSNRRLPEPSPSS